MIEREKRRNGEEELLDGKLIKNVRWKKGVTVRLEWKKEDERKRKLFGGDKG